MARTTKLELEQLLAARNQEIVQLRHRISVLEGEAQLRAPRPTNPNAPIVERYGQRVIKRWPARTA